MGLGRVGQRELVSDDRSHGASFPEAEDVARSLLDEIRTQAQESPEEESVDACVAADEPLRFDGLPVPARRFEDDCAHYPSTTAR